ncbi:unnamed protein product [Diamesa serratosioi]
MEVKGSEKKVFKKLRPINAKFFKKLGDEGRKSIKNAFDSLQAEKQTEVPANIYASNNNSICDTYEQNIEVKKVPGERKILVQKVEIVYPPRRVSHYFSKTYQQDKNDNTNPTYDNYCDTVQSTEESSQYHDTVEISATEHTDDTLTNTDETKNTNLEQLLMDTLTSPTNTIKFTSKCPENRSNNIIPLKMKRIIKKPKIILRTSRFGRTQVLNNATQQVPEVPECIPTIDDITTRLDSTLDSEIPVQSVANDEILSECLKHSDILPQEQGSELILEIKNVSPPTNALVFQSYDIHSVIPDPQRNEFDEAFHGFESNEKESHVILQIKHLEKVLKNFNNFQEAPEIPAQYMAPNISQINEIKSETTIQEFNNPPIQTKDLHNFTFTKDDIEKLDETLKDTNSCSILEDLELENTKLKLIVRHLMEKLQISTLKETFVFEETAEVTEKVTDALMQEDDSIIMNHLTNSNDDVKTFDAVVMNEDNSRKRKNSSSQKNVETLSKISRTTPVLEEPIAISDRFDLLETSSIHNSSISSRRNSAESIISEATSHKSTEVTVEPLAIPTLIEKPSVKEKKATSRRSSKVEKQSLKRSKHKISSRTSSIESIPKPKKDKKNLVQTKLCFNKQIDDLKKNITTSTPKSLRSNRSESTSSTNKNEMIRVDYMKESVTETVKNTVSKVVTHSTDFCKVMEELNVTKKSKKPKVIANDIKPTSTTRERHSHLSNRIKSEETNVVPPILPLPVEQNTSTSKVSKDKSKSVVKQKSVETIVNNSNKNKKDAPEKVKRGRKSGISATQILTPPVLPEEKLEKAIESRVPYDQILTVLRFSSHVSNGRPTLQEKAAIEKKRKETKKLLEALKYFHCGSCQKDVTKQMWHQHWINHGGIAWIDGFEKPFNLNDWEDSLRRFVNNMKTYEVSSLVCAICSEERRSAVGHLSHIIICGFDEETVEARKKECSTCDARMLPFNYPYHKKICTGLVELKTNVEVEEDEDEVAPTSAFDSSGRVKRKAVQKAEKKFKSMLKVFANPLDNLKVKNGIIKCRLCVQSFTDQDVAINHIKTDHEAAKDLFETDDSASDASVHDGSSEESDGSSGDEESEFQTNSDEDSDVAFNHNNVRKRAARPLQTTLPHDSYEMSHVKMAISKVVADWRKMQRITTATLKWTTESHRKNWINEVFPELLASVTVKLEPDTTTLLQSLNFNTKSMKFTNKICASALQFEHQFNIKPDDWEQLQFANVKYDKQGITMFCGGQVSSLDWSPSNSKLNYLAVACNNDASRESNHIVTETHKSIIQIFQFQDLSINADNCCQLMYAFVVNEGPVWSVKFCPTGAPTQQRIGLIAVSTSIGDVLIYSLPNIQHASQSLLHLTPCVVCKVKDEMIFNDIFNQACQLAWFHNCKINLLTAGFLDGTVAIWDMNNMKSHKKEASSNVIYPSSVIVAHIERITAIDIRSTNDAIYLVTSGLDRKVRTFSMNETNVLHEVSNYQCKSRLFSAKWWHNWPTMLLGEDECFTTNTLFMRNPYEFAFRYHSFYAFPGSVMDISINNFVNTAMVVTDSGDVFGYEAPQLLICSDMKFKENELKFHSFADFSKIRTGDEEEIGIVFCDLKVKLLFKSNRKRRQDDLPYINNLQINQVCFNPNENTNKCYALGYANGFVRVRFIPKPK